MLYQGLLMEPAPRVSLITNFNSFSVHCHHEIELLYCREGSFEATVDGTHYTVAEGSLLFVGSMAAHEVVCETRPTVLLIEVGPMFLREHFKSFCEPEHRGRLFDLEEAGFSELRQLFGQIILVCAEKSEYSALKITGNLYNICACLLEKLNGGKKTESENRIVEAIGNALELVHYHYKENITVDDAAVLTGYSKSNFCKLFKLAVGTSFHAYLNHFRIENARYLLSRTGESVENVASMIGFSDSKNFCRAFKRETGQTPLEYRKSI